MRSSINGDEAGNGGAGGGKEERIYVSVRVRPLSSKEIERNEQSDWEVINHTTIIFKNNLPDRSMPPSAYTYDRVFDYNCDTRKVYEEGAKEVALSVLSGINSSIFAYGQTSSGKTYTMNGITEYFMEDVYDYIKKHEEREFLLKFSAMEIYNEAVRDLLSSDCSHLRLLDDPERGTVVEKLTEETLRNESHFKELLAICEAQRQIGETYLNEASSRSHQILRLTIESSAREFRASSLAAAVNFVDLAGSERASQTLSAGSRLKEGSHINRSLLTLGTVIRKLSHGRNAHVPYRDSKLTRILQNSLGGNARTAIICTMSPARSHIEQSRNTLLFASCAKEVVTSAQVNVIMSDKGLVKHLRRELARLEDELRYVSSVQRTSNTDEMKVKDAQIIKMEKEMMLLIQQRDLAQSRLKNFVRSVGDDRASKKMEESNRFLVQLTSNDHAFRHWDESSQPSFYRAGTSEDESSVSEASGICYQSPEFGISKCRIPHSNHYYDMTLQPPATSTGFEISASDASYIPHNTSRAQEIASDTSEEHPILPAETEAPLEILKKSEKFSGGECKFQDVKGPDNEDKVSAKHCQDSFEVDIPSISHFVEGLNKMAHVQYQRQLTKKREMRNVSLENIKIERITKDFTADTADPSLCSSESLSQWDMEFEKLQKEIIELWDACNVPLIHRTYFFLLFNGEPADSIYMEVERRRLSFLKKTISQESGNNFLSSSIKNLRRERDMLHRRMMKKLSSKEREQLYRKWGIKLASKQRRIQLARRLWTDTTDIEEIRESA
ncbi:kinesin-like protein KIN-7F, partial [Phalaenopsis equestris]|uniref:kinesin-like protein KIN-7F n=1 Tax=Phalaenopsis equestris TaxID=78828 RepID=UPI0009E58E0A